MLTGDPFQCFNRLEGAPRVTASIVDTDGPGFTRAWRLTTLQPSANAWDLRLRCFNTRPARRNDVGVATFWMRSTRETPALIQFVLEMGASPYTKPADWTASAGPAWKLVQVPFRWDKDYSGATSGETSYNLSFWVTFDNQEVEIGGFQLLNYGPDADVRSMNLAGYPYEGSEPDAPWRAEAAARIERYRKGDIEVAVVDANGKPVAGAPVRVRMKRHAFGFATAIDCGTLMANTADGERYRQELVRNFNKVAIENDLKWPFFETWAAGRFDPAERWLRANGFDEIHGHVLVWPGSRNLPADVQNMLSANPVDKDALRARVNGHIERMVDFTRGRVTEWDVLNEPFDNKDIQAALGDREMAEWFKLARRRDPNLRLFLNDYGNVERGGYIPGHTNFTFDTLKLIQAEGGPVDGFGFQSHFSGRLTDPVRAYEIFERFAREVDTIQVTEFDVAAIDDDVQARYTRDYLTIAFSHPKMNGFTLWGFWAGRHWKPEAAMFARDWSPKPNLEAWRDLIFREWWTDVAGSTGEDGLYRVRGFLGDYEIDAVGTTKPLRTAPGTVNRVELRLP